MVPVRRQAIIWINDGLVYWIKSASLGLSELYSSRYRHRYGVKLFPEPMMIQFTDTSKAEWRIYALVNLGILETNFDRGPHSIRQLRHPLLCQASKPIGHDPSVKNRLAAAVWVSHTEVRKRWRATAWCGKSKFTISSGRLKNGSLCHPDDIITLS